MFNGGWREAIPPSFFLLSAGFRDEGTGGGLPVCGMGHAAAENDGF
jgi:hypothetical protein